MSSVVDIVIVNWNSGHYLAECIESVRAFGGDALGHVVIVDNGSTDGSLSSDESWPTLKVIRTGENLGFAKACNLGASNGDSPYVLFLNPDARLLESTLDKALAFMESESATHIGICGVRLIDEKGETQRHCAHFPIWLTYVGRVLGLEGVIPGVFPSLLMREFDHLTNRAVDHVIGAFFLVRRSLFTALSGFDERFFVYLEDLDFSLRAKQAGWSTWYLAEAVAFHKGHGTSENVKSARLFYSIRSRMLYAMKHFSPTAAAAVILLALFVEPISRLVRAALRGSGQEAWDTICGYAMIWKGVPALLYASPNRHRVRTLKHD